MKKALIATGAIAVAALVLVAANYHIVTGSTVSGVTFQKKMSMSLSETFVNLDSVGNMPMIVARAQYPMFVASMERGVAAVQKAIVKSCSDLAPGMYRSEALDLCGKPGHVDSVAAGEEIMHWDNGLMVKVQSGRITFVSR